MKTRIDIKVRMIILLVTTSFLNVGCSTVKVIDKSVDPGFSIANYKSYDFLKMDFEIDALPDFEKRIAWIKMELDTQLKIKGLTQSSDNPDLLINIGIVIEEKIQTRETDFRTDAPRYMGTRNYSWQSEEVEVGKYYEGTFTVDFVDPVKEALLWQGVVQGVIVKKDEASKKNIAKGAEEFFKKLD